MARILVDHIRYPEFDRCSGDQRLTNFIRLLAESNQVTLHALHQLPPCIAAPGNAHYRKLLQSAGIEMVNGSLREHLRERTYDAVVIEFWYVASIIRDIRLIQPNARLVVDTEHIYFYSDQWKAKTLGEDPNSPELVEKKRKELTIYRRPVGGSFL